MNSALVYRLTVPKPLLDQNQFKFGVVSQDINGLKIEVTSLERALVDLFDKPHLGGVGERGLAFPGICRVLQY